MPLTSEQLEKIALNRKKAIELRERKALEMKLKVVYGSKAASFVRSRSDNGVIEVMDPQLAKANAAPPSNMMAMIGKPKSKTQVEEDEKSLHEFFKKRFEEAKKLGDQEDMDWAQSRLDNLKKKYL